MKSAVHFRLISLIFLLNGANIGEALQSEDPHQNSSVKMVVVIRDFLRDLVSVGAADVVAPTDFENC